MRIVIKKEDIVKPRKTWNISPVQKVKDSKKTYDRKSFSRVKFKFDL
jgi:hypothetical protein